MITPDFNPSNKRPLYEQLYSSIRVAIQDGRLPVDEKLPSKRKLAAHLGLAVITMENAYAQLLAEGFIRSAERRGYFVNVVQRQRPKADAETVLPLGGAQPAGQSAENVEHLSPESAVKNASGQAIRFDLKTNAVNTDDFPYATWLRLMRAGMRESPKLLLEPIHPQGEYGLRQEIARRPPPFANTRAHRRSYAEKRWGEGRAGLSAIGVLQQRPQRDAHSGCRLWWPERKRAARDGRLVGCGLAVG